MNTHVDGSMNVFPDFYIDFKIVRYFWVGLVKIFLC